MTHTYGNQRLIDWFNTDGNEYNEYYDEEAKILCEGLLTDLKHESNLINVAVEQNKIVYGFDIALGDGLLEWDVDLVIGEPKDNLAKNDGWHKVGKDDEFETVLLAADVKSVMTSHTNNRKNRIRVLLSLGLHVDEIWAGEPGDNPPMHSDAMAAGLVVMNTAEKFRYDDRVTENPSTVEKTARQTANGLNLGVSTTESVNGLAAVLIDYEGRGSTASMRDDGIAPDPGEPAHYGTFLESIAGDFESRFL